MDCWGTPFITDLHPDIEQLTIHQVLTIHLFTVLTCQLGKKCVYMQEMQAVTEKG